MLAEVDILIGIQWWTHVVVHGVQDGVSSELGGTAREVVDVVVLEGDLVIRAGEVQVPVVVSVASGRPLALAVDVAVGDRDTAGRILAQDDVLTGDLVGGDVVDPDQVGAGQGDGITSPDVLGVELGDADVLDDDVLHAVGHAQTLALDDSRGAGAEDGLVRGDLDGVQTGLVVGDRDGGSVGLVVGAPVVLVDGLLASGASSPGSTSGLGGGALGSGEVEGLGQNDDASLGVGEVGDTGEMISTMLLTHGAKFQNTYSSSVVEGVTAAASPPPVTEAAKPSGVPETVGVAACARAAKPAARRGAECILVMMWSECGKKECIGKPGERTAATTTKKLLGNLRGVMNDDQRRFFWGAAGQAIYVETFEVCLRRHPHQSNLQ